MRQPYNQTPDGMVTVYQGDNRAILDELTLSGVVADLILTDPPYNVSAKAGENTETESRLPTEGTRRTKQKPMTLALSGMGEDTSPYVGTAGRRISRRFGGWDYNWSAETFLVQANDILRDGGQLIAFTSEFLIPDWLKTPLTHRGLIFWQKTNPTPALPQMYLRPIEIAVWQTKGSKWTFNGNGYTSPVYTMPSISGGSVHDMIEPRVHPTQKPQELARRILANHAKPGDLVIDPFMGSGSFVRAAYDLGMRVIGIDAGEDDTGVPWVEHAAKLMRQQRLPL